jgi:hypothetical protein
MISHTRQEWFELAVRGLARQGWRQSYSASGDCCRYRLGELKCAIGHGIPDEAYQSEWDEKGKGAESMARGQHIGVADNDVASSIMFLESMQWAHDGAGSPKDVRKRMGDFCTTHNLTWPADVAREGEI